MNRNTSRLAIIVVLLLSATLLLAACQRERPAAEEEGWSESPIEQPTATSQPGEPLTPQTGVTTVSVEPGAAEPTPGNLIEVTPGAVSPTAQPLVTAEPAVIPVGQTFEYIVKPGDTLFSIALTYDTDVDTLRSLNNLPDDTIQVGQILVVPGTGPAAVPGQPGGAATEEPVAQQVIYVVEVGDTLSSIANEFGVDWRDIAAFNDIQPPNYTIYRGQELVIPGVSPTPEPTEVVTIHVVQAGETLSSIAVQYGVTVQDIMTANQLSDPDLIRPGQELVIPG